MCKIYDFHEQSTIDNRQSTIDNRQSTIDNRQSTIETRGLLNTLGENGAILQTIRDLNTI
ncbi:MAG: hypothetical protein LBB19_04205 [Puniceicoccales bacterium]|nr:hypothetical protein [Puniceicoccales bacterium]